ncbi:hypothetical protein GCM10010346_63450 [Streptomyces chryseus]|uniref:Uncharacterized protein n=1 Tax=Streptomyces chryseus TaxID=68186 RepID=A0ABQ3EBR3_9ACTN|nr:hypothetical protein GCM10010346_63450 [Streptomyces chryseus]
MFPVTGADDLVTNAAAMRPTTLPTTTGSIAPSRNLSHILAEGADRSGLYPKTAVR